MGKIFSILKSWWPVIVVILAAIVSILLKNFVVVSLAVGFVGGYFYKWNMGGKK